MERKAKKMRQLVPAQINAIKLTEIGLKFGYEYVYNGIEAYQLHGADGQTFVVKTNCRKVTNE